MYFINSLFNKKSKIQDYDNFKLVYIYTNQNKEQYDFLFLFSVFTNAIFNNKYIFSFELLDTINKV